MDKHIVLGIHIVNREEHAVEVQEVLTQYGKQIKTRLGLHDDICAENGLILLELCDSDESVVMIEKLSLIKGVECKQMDFKH